MSTAKAQEITAGQTVRYAGVGWRVAEVGGPELGPQAPYFKLRDVWVAHTLCAAQPARRIGRSGPRIRDEF